MYYTPLQQLKANLENKRILARDARENANKRLQDAEKLEQEAAEIEVAVKILEAAGQK